MSRKPSTGARPFSVRIIRAHRARDSVQTTCRVLGVAPSGYYRWLQQPISNRAQEDARLLRLIRASFVASHGSYGDPRVFLDLREPGETSSKHRVGRLMREANLRARYGLSLTALVGRQAVAPAPQPWRGAEVYDLG
jgi:putative transposase